ncbi:uncharacterized protein [Penaeus vannamei]|uniref:uncharacterized protein isoform X3 n=1 Tax=Penaeus vannamei TaxID=6689 RepID=UPI00387FAAEE
MQAVDKDFIEQMRRVQVAVAVNIVMETPSHLTPRRYAANLLAVLARTRSANGQAEHASRPAHTHAGASHAGAHAACPEAPASLAPSPLPATASATTASRDGNSGAAVVQALCATQHPGDVDESSRAAEGRSSEAQQPARGAGHPSQAVCQHPLETSVGTAYPSGMVRESQHPTMRMTTVSYQLHTEAGTRNIAAQCPRKVVAGSLHPAKTLKAVHHTAQTACGSGLRRGPASAAQHITEPGVIAQRSREITASTQTVMQTARNTRCQRTETGTTRLLESTGTVAQQPVHGAKESEDLGEIAGAAQRLGFAHSRQASHQQSLLNRCGAINPQQQPQEEDKSRESLHPKRQENWTSSSSQSLAAEMEREMERFKAGMPVDWPKCREIAQILGDRVVAAQKADRGLEETCLSVTTRFVAMLLKADREGPPPLLYDRRRHHDRTANWWCVLSKVTGVVTPLCTAPPLMLRSGNILVEALINVARRCGDAKDRPPPRPSEEIPRGVAAAAVPSLDAALAALESSLSHDQVPLFDDALHSPLASAPVISPLPSHCSSLPPEDVGARRLAMDARWHLLYWKSVLEDQCLALFSGSDGEALPMFVLQLEEIVQAVSRICQDSEEALFLNRDLE